jgi:hypothetical protein
MVAPLRIFHLVMVVGLLGMSPCDLSAGMSCRGLTGGALEQCLQGAASIKGGETFVFLDESGNAVQVNADAAGRSMEAVCQAAKRDGTFTAYKMDRDRRAQKKWKEVECRGGKLTGFWKEYFPGDDITTILFYDPSGTAVKQQVLLGDRLLKEQEFSKPARK